MDGNGNCWCFNGFLLAKSGWRQSYFKVGNRDWGHNFANLVIKPTGACHQTARYASNGALAENRCLWRGFSVLYMQNDVAEQVRVSGWLLTKQCSRMWTEWYSLPKYRDLCVCVCVCACKAHPCVPHSVSLLLSVQAYCLSGWIR